MSKRDQQFRTKAPGSITVAPGPHTHVESDVTSLIADLAAKVPTSRTVNGKALSSNITLTGDDVLPSQTGNSGKFLTTNGTTVSWGTPAGGSSSLATLTDVTVSSPATGHILRYNAGTSKWENVAGSSVFEPAITAGTTAQYWRGDKSWQTLDKTAVGLSNVANVDQRNASNLTSGTVPDAQQPARLAQYGSVSPSSAISDLNTATTQGWYSSTTNPTNAPAAGSFVWWVEVVAFDSSYTMQTATVIGIGSATGQGRFRRFRAAGTWGSWFAIEDSNSATVTLTNKTLTSPVISSPTGLVKGDVGLGNVDNTSDATKNSAVATVTNKDLTSGTNTFPTFNQNTTGSAAKWTTARTVALTGDVTWSQSVDGSANVSGAATLATSGVSAGTYPGSTSSVPNITVDAKGRVTAASSSSISIGASQVASGTMATARLGSGTANSGTFLRGDSTWAAPSDPRLTGWKFNLLATSGSGSDPGAGNLRFFTGGVAVYLNYTDSDSKDRSAWFTNLFNSFSQGTLIISSATATEIALWAPDTDNGTDGSYSLTTTLDPSVFTVGQPVYVSFIPQF